MGQVLMVRRLAQRELEVLYADPETEFAADVWDLRKVGLAAGRNTCVLDFSTITQDWLREAAKAVGSVPGSLYAGAEPAGGAARGVAVVASRLRCAKTAGMRSRRSRARTCAHSSSGLGGFIARAGCRRRRYYRSAGKVRQFLRECRDFGLYEPGEPLHGLSGEFAVWQQDLRRPAQGRGRRRRGPGAAAGGDRPAALRRATSKRLRERYGEDMLVMLRILADTGRRPDELAKLMASCLDRTEFIDEQTGELQSSLGARARHAEGRRSSDFRLFISESTAQLIIEQRERVVARYPGTPLSRAAAVPARADEPRRDRAACTRPGSAGLCAVGSRACRSLLGRAARSSRASACSRTRFGTASRSATPTTARRSTCSRR